MSDRHIFVGLGEFGFRKAKEISSYVENSIYFGIAELAFQPNEHYHVFYDRRFRIEDIYLEGRNEIRKWNKSDIRFYYSKGLMLSRADFRMLYEFRDFLVQNNSWKDLIYECEITNPRDNDNIHIIIPYFENSAHGIAFFVAWDIKDWYAKQNLSVNIVAHFILPDTPLYNFNSKVELQADYRGSCSFIKELIAIIQICNGDAKIKEKLGDITFSLGRWFNIDYDFGKLSKIPFDNLALIGLNAPIDFENHQLNDRIRNELTDEIVTKVIYQEDILNCYSSAFEEEIYSKYPLFGSNGRATSAYNSFLNYKEKNVLYESAHLDYHWDGIL